MRRTFALLVLTTGLSTAPAFAQTPAAATHATWQSCLRHAFTLVASLSGADLAADAALRRCRSSEAAYIDALALSPLVDADDAARIRPALADRARLWLLAGHSRSL